MKTVAVKNIERADAAIASRLGEIGASTVHEAQGRTGLLKPYMRPIYPRAKLGGTALTVLVQLSSVYPGRMHDGARQRPRATPATKSAQKISG